MISNVLNTIRTSVENGLVTIQNKITSLPTAIKTHNFAVSILSAGLAGLVIHLCATIIPTYVFIGIPAGLALHAVKGEVIIQLRAQIEAKKVKEFALTVLSLAAASWFLYKSAVCAIVVAIVMDPKWFLGGITALLTPKTTPQPPGPDQVVNL